MNNRVNEYNECIDEVFINEEFCSYSLDNYTYKYCDIRQSSFNDVVFDCCYFMECIFDHCDLSNIEFSNCMFKKCRFIECKMMGTNINDSILNDCMFDKSMCAMICSFDKFRNSVFKECNCSYASFYDIQFKKSFFRECDLTRSEFFNTSLRDMDMSSNILYGINIQLNDLEGMVIEEYQSIELIHLLRVKLKKDE